MTNLSELTTLRVGGPAARLETATDPAELARLAGRAWADGEPLLVVGGGSNLLVGDDGFDGTVLRIATRGIERATGAAEGRVRVRVQAGESWDGLVAWAVEQGLSGIEALSGIPGLAGGAPVQNIGAYGQELSESLVAIDFLAEGADAPVRMSAAELELGYRTSVLKQGLAGIVVSIELELHDTAAEREVLGDALGQPIAYAQLANALGVQLGDRVPLARVRESVLGLRRSKGMVLDAADPDTASAGSFFTNPIVTERFARTLPADAPRWVLAEETPDEIVPLDAADAADASPLDEFLAFQRDAEESAAPPAGEEPAETLVKLSAAWLIEQSGIHRGFALPASRAGVSSKHTLSITNRGGATAAEIAELARFVQNRVHAEFGVVLHPEPVLVGVSL
ncbi:UDP-N-acetylmuramate dehydrogenase [Agromyces archimandritae]|uniref:UDP-N-acetylenolpyruvoylglucosamine reductase n=1 Tax=Agromyces archimandritae TaxID=2781962 RepID=A0A975FQH8_9MICO|nr:UDP-N-acetylmuramate dehydrogenase [Agromyces archimandritae]QTX06266.1 UDP-N-acetylmuramate dehydrogenase [Agromyces archimandritae]